MIPVRRLDPVDHGHRNQGRECGHDAGLEPETQRPHGAGAQIADREQHHRRKEQGHRPESVVAQPDARNAQQTRTEGDSHSGRDNERPA